MPRIRINPTNKMMINVKKKRIKDKNAPLGVLDDNNSRADRGGELEELANDLVHHFNPIPRNINIITISKYFLNI